MRYWLNFFYKNKLFEFIVDKIKTSWCVCLRNLSESKDSCYWKKLPFVLPASTPFFTPDGPRQLLNMLKVLIATNHLQKINKMDAKCKFKKMAAICSKCFAKSASKDMRKIGF